MENKQLQNDGESEANDVYAREYDSNQTKHADSTTNTNNNAGDSETDDSDDSDDDDYGPAPVAGVWAGSQKLIDIAESEVNDINEENDADRPSKKPRVD